MKAPLMYSAHLGILSSPTFTCIKKSSSTAARIPLQDVIACEVLCFKGPNLKKLSPLIPMIQEDAVKQSARCDSLGLVDHPFLRFREREVYGEFLPKGVNDTVAVFIPQPKGPIFWIVVKLNIAIVFNRDKEYCIGIKRQNRIPPRLSYLKVANQVNTSIGIFELQIKRFRTT